MSDDDGRDRAVQSEPCSEAYAASEGGPPAPE